MTAAARHQVGLRLTRWLKVLMPVLALLLLSTLFLFSGPVVLPDPATVTQIDLVERATSEGLTAPAFASVTRDGDALVIRADRAQPDKKDYRIVHIDQLQADVTRAAGDVVHMQAKKALLDLPRQQVLLSGGVRTVTSSGYVVETDRLVLWVERFRALADQAVRAQGPIGSIEAEGMEITTNRDFDRTEVLFTGNVKLLYKPKVTGDVVE